MKGRERERSFESHLRLAIQQVNLSLVSPLRACVSSSKVSWHPLNSVGIGHVGIGLDRSSVSVLCEQFDPQFIHTSSLTNSSCVCLECALVAFSEVPDSAI